ncbi:MAG: DEAD/DEAH box helicase [Candidatus Aminicenantes bacterium]|nr:DEAD/DEAH box helicase [Candidatus Aminicenantes bacterium]NIM84200.1 DEAD/DEAH box helicase [Candidatus Aminicenantes bacterium]NIN23649.1 DEAD/DEAH box helicase [Candidatus Aminicenantes bacterium]NIN47356.1 DEAD/DEAH box helicase [Candidatus Aminicenantes bacterium]NIN90284.1 DEAD/DEAH box helicase [Candidatus Aminicenantes bacterium]
MQFKPGALVHVRDRDWVVLPSPDDDLVLLKPLDGSEEDITGIYRPLDFEEDLLESAEFPHPGSEDLGDFASARLLYNAARLSIRNASGPFRSMGKLSFRPRAYQMVPLIMALRQNYPLRVLIADDVGVGKTIEALIVLKELLERGEISRFAVIVLPHLCEQWQEELKDKFGIDAVVIRTNTQARLDREIPGDIGVFQYYPYQVISIDYIKSPARRQMFIQDCPELVIVDEAHTCSIHSRSHKVQQQRHRLIKDISQKPGQHLILLTATPHSGKAEQFNSLLGLIKPEYETMDLPAATQQQRRELARYYVQRRRKDVEKWMDQDTPFPHRDPGEYKYELSPKYAAFYIKIRKFALSLTTPGEPYQGRQRIRYWAVLALLRGVMSSPAAGVEMLKNRIKKAGELDEKPIEDEDQSNLILDVEYGAQDYMPSGILNRASWSDNEISRLNQMAKELEELQNLFDDNKVLTTLQIITQWLDQGFTPVIFCRFIATANYVGAVLKEEFTKKGIEVDLQVITSEDPDDVRKSRIEEMAVSEHKVLVATDCLSEGINLQEQFTAVLHYDLPWNPNRLEQREGRIDRYGQQAKEVKAYLLYSEENPIDRIVFKVLLKKVRQIRKAIGIAIPFSEDTQSFVDAVFQEVMRRENLSDDGQQRRLDFGEDDPFKQKELEASRAIEEAADREKESRTIFAQNAIKADEIEEDLKQSDQAVGSPEAVEAFVTETLTSLLGVQIQKDKKKKGYSLYPLNLPPVLKEILPEAKVLKVSFHSPTPEGYLYLGRNHAFVEQLCQYVLAHSFKPDSRNRAARAAVIKTRNVTEKTTFLLLRVRNVLEEKKTGRQMVAEEMLVWGYRGNPANGDIVEENEVERLMRVAVSTSNVSNEATAYFLENELEDIKEIREILDNVALQRAQVLIDAHERFRTVVGGKRYKIVKPVLPMDVMGIYILLPDKITAEDL